MAEMDPIIRDALKRSSQMGYIPKQQQRQPQTKKQEKKPESQAVKKEAPPPEPKNIQSEIKLNSKETGLEALLKNKEQSLILLLAVLLMNENSSPELILALMYLLI